MKKFDVVIIGSGLGGMICANILSKEGYNVCVLEKNHQLGGSMQTFKRDGVVFDTGAHYIGGIEEGQNLYQYFKYLDLIDNINIKRLDNNAFDLICFGDNGKDYPYGMGYDNFTQGLAKHFPDEKDALNKFIDKTKEIANAFPLYQLKEPTGSFVELEFFKESINGFLDKITNNERLKNVLGGTNLLYAGKPYISPVYVHCLINNSYIESAYRFIDGSSQVIDHLAKTAKENGVTIYKSTEVKELEFNDKAITSAKLTNGESVFAKNFISNVHPSMTLDMIPGDKVRKMYRNRINGLENTISVFSVYITFRENTFKYLNQNIYYYNQCNVWTASTYDTGKWPENYMMVTQALSGDSQYAAGVTIMTYMKYDEMKKWENTFTEKRDDSYEVFKMQKAEKLIDLVEKRYTNIRSCIKKIYTSTPLTYKDYIATKEGALYGIQKDCREPIKSIVIPKTRIPNLFFTGQNVSMHGVLGVTIGAFLSCAELLGIDYLLKKIKEKQ